MEVEIVDSQEIKKSESGNGMDIEDRETAIMILQ